LRVVVFGASGNVGTALLSALRSDSRVGSVVAVARRLPTPAARGDVDWRSADIGVDDLDSVVRGADVVVSLAWRIQPSRKLTELWQTNVLGSSRVFEATARANVASLVYASSVGAYVRGPRDRAVDESWPIGGVPTSFYARHKAEVERRLDLFESEHPAVRVVRLRPALVFQRASASEQRRLFMGPLVPRAVFRRGLLPFMPYVRGLRFQAVHAKDAADAYRLATVGSMCGAFNVAAEPVIDEAAIGAVLATRTVALPATAARAAVALSWRLRLQPSPPGWLDMGMDAPLLNTTRAHDVLGWRPSHDAHATLADLLGGLRDGAGAPTPPLDPNAGGPLRRREFATLSGTREFS
jgi:UDP-glucose 4-epimerase